MYSSGWNGVCTESYSHSEEHMHASYPGLIRLTFVIMTGSVFAVCFAAGATRSDDAKAVLARAEAPDFDMRARTELAVKYLVGNGVSRDTAMAVKLFREIDAWIDANQEKLGGYVPKGTGEIRFTLGKIYVSGDDRVPKDLVEAEKWYRKAAKIGHTGAQLSLGNLYEYKDGVEAVKWFRLAAEQGDAKAQLGLSRHYFRGDGVPNDEVLGASWARKAAEQGDSRAMSVLAGCCYYGNGVPKDVIEGARWDKMAAENGDGWIQIEYARRLMSGLHMPKDQAEAVKWLLRAARCDKKSGGVNAQARLGFLYLNGYETVAKDEVQAVRWLRMAAEQGDQEARQALEKLQKEIEAKKSGK
jgi:TPR repeat protein